MALDTTQWLWAILCAFLIGFAKTGFSGVATLVVPIMAAIFGGKESSGIVLPMLIVGDLLAVKKYSSHADWKYIRRLLPWAMAGIILGLAVGNAVSDLQFKRIIAIIVLLGLCVMIWQEIQGDGAAVPHQWWFSALLGLAGGFSTMIGNAAGPVMGIYLLAMRLPKLVFIGTGAWFFMIINAAKVPLQIFFWKGITLNTLTFNLMLVPAIALGAFIGIKVVRHVPERPFRYAIIAITALTAVKLFF
jgi:uncharacterized membrane protein YfcA